MPLKMISLRPTGRNLLLFGLLTCSCYSHIPVNPEALPALSNSFSAPVASSNGELLAVRVARVERPDGTLVEVKGEFDVHITLTGGEVLNFEHPIQAHAESSNAAIVIAGGNRAAHTIALSDIEQVEVVQLNRMGTAGVIAGASVVTLAGTIVILLVALT